MVERIAAVSAKLAYNIMAPQYFFCPAPACSQPGKAPAYLAAKAQLTAG